MLTIYLHIFGVQGSIILLILGILSGYFLIRRAFTNTSAKSKGERLNLLGTTILSVGFLIVFLYSILLVALYGENIPEVLMLSIIFGISATCIAGGIFNLYYKKQIVNGLNSQLIKALLMVGIGTLIFLIVYYFIWIA